MYSGGGEGVIGGGNSGHGSGQGNLNENGGEFGDDDNGCGKNDTYSLFKCCGGICGGIVVIIVSLSFVIVGVAVLGISIDKSNNYAETMGTIIDLRSCESSCSGSTSNGSQCSETYAIIVEYTVGDTNYVIELDSCSNPGPTVGNDIKVLYDPDNPEQRNTI